MSCALWTSAEIVAATGGTRKRRVRSDRRDLRQPRGRRGRFVRGDAGHGVRRSSLRRSSLRRRGRRRAGVAAGRWAAHPRSGHVRSLAGARPRQPRRARPAKIVGVTGSVGKTSTKEALAAALERGARGRVHRSVKSYNNHTGVPLSLARMPRDVRICRARNGHEQPRRDRRADPAGPPARRFGHRDRLGPHRESRQRGSDRRRQGRNLRRARG